MCVYIFIPIHQHKLDADNITRLSFNCFSEMKTFNCIGAWIVIFMTWIIFNCTYLDTDFGKQGLVGTSHMVALAL